MRDPDADERVPTAARSACGARRGAAPSAAAARRSIRPTAIRRDAREAYDDGWAQPVRRSPPRTRAAPGPRRRSRSSARARSSRATIRPTSRSRSRSIRTRGASTAASTATRGRRTPISTCRRASTSRRSCSPSPTRPRCCAPSSRKPGYACEPIALGTNTDPYQPIEREWKITRQILEVLAEHEHPFTIVTKSRAGRARPRPHRADGREEHGARLSLDHDARPRPRAHARAARGGAAAPAAGDAHAARRRAFRSA